MYNTSLSFSNDSILHPESSLIRSFHPFGLHCLTFIPGSLVFTFFTVIILLIHLPLCVFVLYCGVQRWRQQRSSSRATTSHSDSISYHLATMELCAVFGDTICCCGIYSNNIPMLFVWYYLYTFTWYGKIFFHVLTCVEHYLAVVYPVTYLSLRKERGIMIRNIITGCIWLLCFLFIIMIYTTSIIIVINACLLLSSLVVISFCSLAVLYILIRPGPGEQGRDRVRVHQSKQRAFYTIVAILGVFLLRSIWNLVWTGTDVLNQSRINECVGIMCEIWINLPSSLVLPLLFLQRTLACCKK